MAKQVILGTDLGRDAFKVKVNDNFTELYDKDTSLGAQINTLVTEVTADTVQIKNISRDLQITGVQTITFDRPVKGLLAFATVNGTDMMSIGAKDKAGGNGLLTKIGTFYNFTDLFLIFQPLGNVNYSQAVVSIEGNNANITWSKVLNGTTGTANATLVAFF